MNEDSLSAKVPSSIVDNQTGNTLQLAIENITGGGKELCIATAFFSLDALAMVAKNLGDCDQVRILFGDDSDRTQRAKLLKRLRETSDQDLVAERINDPTLEALQTVDKLFKQGKIKARCYTSKKFHAKAYIATREHFPNHMGVLGSGNFTRPGLTRNIELNVHLTPEQTLAVKTWFEERWNEAAEDDVTEVVHKEIKRQVDLYDPYAIYQRALIKWGDFYQGGLGADDTLKIKDMLDPHQLLGYRRALEILNRDHGVFVCDGVGLGKSFIALALMEHFCQLKKNVLLIAPKSIMESSWNVYLAEHLEGYRQPFGTIHEKPMTDLAFDLEDETDSESLAKKQDELRKLIERADVIVLDESHNFRTPSILRYENLYRIVESRSQQPENRKKVILLSATPVNTKYQDLSAQLALITHDRGTIAGHDIAKIRAALRDLDAKSKKKDDSHIQFTLDFQDGHDLSASIMTRVLESVAIQRKRTTCIDLAKAVGKQLLFPNREKPTTVEYELGFYKEVVEVAHKRFAPTASYLKKVKDEYRKVEDKGGDLKILKLSSKLHGIKFAGYLPEQYKTQGTITKRNYQVEVFLAGLVFVNVMKQLESSPAAFQGILQSLGTGLIARLNYVFGDSVQEDIEEHLEWIRTPINQLIGDADTEELESGELADLNGTELDEWLEKIIGERHLHKKLDGFTAELYDRGRWKKDILEDLRYLKEIHEEAMVAKQFQDEKLETAKRLLQERLSKGQRIVVFTQSKRTAYYLEKQLREAFPDRGVDRIDSNVEQKTRADILYAFCPNYNPKPSKTSRKRVDILICTDVLSEGVNLQEAECIVNYDIHWNPVRLIQRIGRVDRRLDPAKNPVPHNLSIINYLPPDEINDIIKLVDTVEDRKTMINRSMGIDQSFFKSDDPENTLKEFNAEIDGEPTALDRANERYIEAIANPDEDIRSEVEAMPLGAYGVWNGAPVNGTFALFEMMIDKKQTLSEADQAKFQGIIGMPVLAVESVGKIVLEAPANLETLSLTVKDERSGNPSNAQDQKDTLRRLKNAVNQSFRNINLVSTIQPQLVCWMEMQKNGN